MEVKLEVILSAAKPRVLVDSANQCWQRFDGRFSEANQLPKGKLSV